MSKTETQQKAAQRWYRFAFGLWFGAGLVAIFAPWPYALAAVLLATFMHFSAAEEKPRGWLGSRSEE